MKYKISTSKDFRVLIITNYFSEYGPEYVVKFQIKILFGLWKTVYKSYQNGMCIMPNLTEIHNNAVKKYVEEREHESKILAEGWIKL